MAGFNDLVRAGGVRSFRALAASQGVGSFVARRTYS